MVFSRSCNADQKGESLQAAYSSPDDRRAIVRNWIQQGITAKVTTVNGDTYNVHNISLDYAPPENYLLVCGVFGCDDPRVNMSVVDRKGSSPRSILFKDIDRIFVNKYGMLGLILKAGEKFEGFLEQKEINHISLVPTWGGILDTGTSIPKRIDLKVRDVATVIFE